MEKIVLEVSPKCGHYQWSSQAEADHRDDQAPPDYVWSNVTPQASPSGITSRFLQSISVLM